MTQQEKVKKKEGADGNETGGFLREFMASTVVFLVALPLCMGIALASGAPPALGLITGIIGGLIVGSIAGSPLQVSGPAAGLTVLVWEIIQKQGLGTLGVIVLIAGLIQFIAGYAKFGRWFRAVSPAVIHGMLAGIGVLIFASQFHIMVDDKPQSSGLWNLIYIPSAIYKGIFPIDGSTHHMAAFIGILAISSLVLWNAFKPKALNLIPGPLVAIVVASATAVISGMGIQFLKAPESIIGALNIPAWSTFAKVLSPKALPGILLSATTLALIASAESLLCASAVDKLHQGARTDYDRELAAQGIGNIACGIVGALPLTGVIVRSSANVAAGAKTRISAILHGVWLLGFVILFPSILNMIPTSALAAILVYIGYKLVNPQTIKELWHTSKAEFGIYITTLAIIVSVDLLSGVVAGLALSFIKLAYSMSNLGLQINDDEENEGHVHVYIGGAATFLRLPQFAGSLEKVNLQSNVHVHLGSLAYIDHACLEWLGSWQKQLEASGGSLTVEWDGLTDRMKNPNINTLPEEKMNPPDGYPTKPIPTETPLPASNGS